jgi:putative Mg2+ transporter-C (MgtC) family protein
MLVCQGAALFMICSVLLTEQVALAGGIADPTRMASTVVQGIGFLAGGLIFTARERVRGLTTAAEIWVAAALGLLIGAGFLFVAIGGAAATVVALVVVRALQVNLPFGRKTSGLNDIEDE